MSVDSHVSTACPTCEAGRGCLLWVDRHTHKNGGTSIRDVMKNLVIKGELDKEDRQPQGIVPHIIFKPPHFRYNCTPRLAFEAHEHIWDFTGRWLHSMRAFKRRQPCCRLVLTTRVREPVAHYISMFQWANIAPKLGR